ncbi:MAG: type II toxin-antitoxin system VapC family toxin [Gemmatimonadaceae bacterium]
MFVIDTNVLVYAADQDSPAHARCRGLVDDWRRQSSAWYVTWPIVYEFLRVSTHPRVFRRPWPVQRAWHFVEALLASPGLGVLAPTGRHPDVAAEVIAELPFLAGNLMHDAHTAVLMREHGIRRVYTRDTDFHRFPFIEPIDPLAGS